MIDAGWEFCVRAGTDPCRKDLFQRATFPQKKGILILTRSTLDTFIPGDGDERLSHKEAAAAASSDPADEVVGDEADEADEDGDVGSDDGPEEDPAEEDDDDDRAGLPAEDVEDGERGEEDRRRPRLSGSTQNGLEKDVHV